MIIYFPEVLTMNKPVLYFAHPVNTYDKQIEKAMLERIYRHFPNFIIENPNQPQHQEGYAEYKKKYENTPGKSGMTYFEEVLENCDGGTIALPFLDCRLGAGVASEVIFNLKRGRDVWFICFTQMPTRQVIRPFTGKEEALLLEWNERKDKAIDKKTLEKVGNTLILSIEETRRRTWTILYKIMRPYEKAHLI
jgi:hypothetical protein